MATYTTNLNLEKPAQTEFYDVDVMNANMDKIDEAFGGSAIEEKSVTLSASGWTGSTAPYTQTVTVQGMTASTLGTVFVAESATDAQYNAALYAALRKTAQGTNSITIKAYGEKPTVNIPLTVRMGG